MPDSQTLHAHARALQTTSVFIPLKKMILHLGVIYVSTILSSIILISRNKEFTFDFFDIFVLFSRD